MGADHMMLLRRAAWGVVVCAVSALAGCSLADDAPQLSSDLMRDSSERTLLSSCINGQLVAKPSSVDLACKTPPINLVDLTWITWGGDTAEATGHVSVMADCQMEDCPNVTQLQSFPAKVTASQVVDHSAVINGKPIVRQYSQLTVQVTEGSLPGGTQEMTFSLPLALSSTKG